LTALPNAIFFLWHSHSPTLIWSRYSRWQLLLHLGSEEPNNRIDYGTGEVSHGLWCDPLLPNFLEIECGDDMVVKVNRRPVLSSADAFIIEIDFMLSIEATNRRSATWHAVIPTPYRTAFPSKPRSPAPRPKSRDYLIVSYYGDRFQNALPPISSMDGGG
jgi:hypothetical protein